MFILSATILAILVVFLPIYLLKVIWGVKKTGEKPAPGGIVRELWISLTDDTAERWDMFGIISLIAVPLFCVCSLSLLTHAYNRLIWR